LRENDNIAGLWLKRQRGLAYLVGQYPTCRNLSFYTWIWKIFTKSR